MNRIRHIRRSLSIAIDGEIDVINALSERLKRVVSETLDACAEPDVHVRLRFDMELLDDNGNVVPLKDAIALSRRGLDV